MGPQVAFFTNLSGIQIQIGPDDWHPVACINSCFHLQYLVIPESLSLFPSVSTFFPSPPQAQAAGEAAFSAYHSCGPGDTPNSGQAQIGFIIIYCLFGPLMHSYLGDEARIPILRYLIHRRCACPIYTLLSEDGISQSPSKPFFEPRLLTYSTVY